MGFSNCMHSMNTFIVNPSNSAFIKVDNYNHNRASSCLKNLSLKNENSIIVACCQDKANLRSSNGCHPISANTVSTAVAATENKMILSKDKKEIGLRDFVACGKENGSNNMIDFESGIGISKFFKGKSLFITGATGFLAKVLIEKMLRSTPEISKIYVLIKAKNKEAAYDRVKNEILGAELNRTLKEIHGNNYESFMMKKLIPVIGNVREANLGIETEIAEEISKEVDIVVNSAANTTFDERYDIALDINTIGPLRLLCFAKRFKKLKLFLHVSTAYVNGRREGKVMEKPFCIGDSIAMELVSPELSTKSMPLLDIEAEAKLAFSHRKPHDDPSLTQEMKELGLKRYEWLLS